MPVSRSQLVLIAGCLVVSLGAFFLTTSEPRTAQQRLLTSSYTTTSTRSSAVNQFCAGLSRTSLVDASLTSQYNVFSSSISSQFSLDGNTLTLNLLNGNFSAVSKQLQGSTTELGLFLGPFVVGLAILLLFSPFICCCCACPKKCPPKMCRKSEDEQYTKCELYWPVATLMAGLLLCIGACIAGKTFQDLGFSQSEFFPQTVTSMSCAGSIVLDDVLNGNVTNNGSSFFLGLRQLDTQLANLNANLTSINNTMANLGSSSTNMTAVKNSGQTALTNTAKVPNNVNASGNMTAISYATPLNSASPSSTVSSLFPAALGSSGTGGYVGTLYQTINAVLSGIAVISTAADNFVAEVTNFQSAVSSLRTTISSFTSNMVTVDASLYSSLQTLEERSSQVHLGVRLFYGATIGVASAMLLATLLVAFCDKIKCRYLIYFSCSLLFPIGLVAFALTLVFSILSPVLYFGCQFMDYSMSSSTHFDTNFANIIPNSTFRGYISTCLPSSSGDIVSALGGSAVNAIQNLSSSLTAMNAFNISIQAAAVQTVSTALSNAISNYQSGIINDISDSSSINILKTLANHSAYSTCSTSYFATDSWVPSTNQNPEYISCLISGGNKATSAVCGGSSFTGATGTCNGCMDTTSIFNTATYTTRTSVFNALNSRYSAAGCSTFNNELANTWNNYYLPKSNAISPVASRGATVTSSVNQFTANLTGTLNATFTAAANSLSLAASSVTDPKYGLVAGLNCQLIGQDFMTFSDTVCRSTFTVSYFSRLVLGCASFGILFAIMCGPCTGVRFLKHQIRKLNSVDNAGLSDDEVHDITNTNFVKPKILE